LSPRAADEALGRARPSCYAVSLSMRLLVCSLLVVLALGCGRQATREDCEAIVDQNVEVQLKAFGVSDADLVEKRQQELRASMNDDIESCIGKRVTDGMMACVKAAETAEQIDKCLR
jgi:hypothetical protein